MPSQRWLFFSYRKREKRSCWKCAASAESGETRGTLVKSKKTRGALAKRGKKTELVFIVRRFATVIKRGKTSSRWSDCDQVRDAATCPWRVASQRLSSSMANRTVSSTRFKQACLFFNKSASDQRLILWQMSTFLKRRLVIVWFWILFHVVLFCSWLLGSGVRCPEDWFEGWCG